MSSYYCPNCTYGLISGSIVDPQLINLSGSFAGEKLYEKYHKHVLNSGSHNINSVFTYDDFDLSSPISYDEYKEYCINTAYSGSLEIDDKGRRNLVWFADKPTGETTISGSAAGHCNGIKLVLWSSSLAIHAYPTSSAVLFSASCACCGHPLV